MNQWLVTSNGGAGRALFKFAGARALNVPAVVASVSACVGATGAGCDGAVEHPVTARLNAAAAAAARIVITLIIGMLRGGLFRVRGAETRRALEQLAAVGQRHRHEDARRFAAADRVHHDRHL